MEVDLSGRIAGYVVGTELGIERDIGTDEHPIPVGVLLDKVWFKVAEKVRDLDSAALLFLEVTTTLTAEGRILDDGGGTGTPTSTGLAQGYGRVLFTPTETQWRKIGSRKLVYAIKALGDDAKPIDVEYGVIDLVDQHIQANA